MSRSWLAFTFFLLNAHSLQGLVSPSLPQNTTRTIEATPAKCPLPPPPPPCRRGPVAPPSRPPRPRRQLQPLPPHLMPRRPPNDPGPLSHRNLILFITQELKRNITFDPHNYTGSWVGNNYCLFKGYYCDTVPDKNITGLAGIDFNGARFRGNLNFNRFIHFLPDIAIFHVNSNNFSGHISPSINGLRYFFELDLSNNGFRGTFPMSVLGSTNLTFLDLRFNNFAGAVNPGVFNLDVEVLFINNNNFNQSIPPTFGNTPALYITLANNKFTGAIPRAIGQTADTLIEVLFLGNGFSGCLPYEIGFLRKATVFDVESNKLTGPIPLSFGCLQSMQLLSLAHNRLYGAIPESLCRLPRAYNFTLSYNYFTQVGPQCRRLIRARRLDVRMNCILGLPFQRSAADCARFFAQPRSCPRERTFNIVPCTLPVRSSSSKEEESTVLAQEHLVAPAPSPTYAALVKPQH